MFFSGNFNVFPLVFSSEAVKRCEPSTRGSSVRRSCALRSAREAGLPGRLSDGHLGSSEAGDAVFGWGQRFGGSE